MSRLVPLNLNPDPRTLRQFGWLALAAFSALAAAAWYQMLPFGIELARTRLPVAGCLLGIGAFGALSSLLAPRLNRPLYVALTIVAYPIGAVVSYLILGLLFFGVIGPIGVLLRLLGKDPLDKRWDANAKSYFTAARPARGDESYFRQY